MLFPIRTNIWPRRTPYANYVLIIMNVAVFLLTYGPWRVLYDGQIVAIPVHRWAVRFMLLPYAPRIWQFVTYAFLHANVMHILGNMFFLYLFGNNVNDRLGSVRFILFYLAGGIVSGVGHVAMHSSSTVPTLGASGAVAAVTGAYLVLFPQTLITVLYWLLFIIGTLELPALWFIGIKLILIDNVILRYTPNAVAYDAHLAGYAFGIVVLLAALATGLLRGGSFDLWAMIRRWNRRRQYRDAVATGYDPFSGTPGRKVVQAREVEKTPEQNQREAQVHRLRTEIGRWIAGRNLAAAADLYLDLMRLDPSQILPRQQLLDVANQLASDSRQADAAKAYEQFLEHYGSYEYAEQVRLMLGLLYARYLHKPGKAVEHLRAAVGRLSDPGQIRLCKEELVRLES